jgi:hypothetical protein
MSIVYDKDGKEVPLCASPTDEVDAVTALLKSLAAAGVIDRAHSVRVGNVEVHLGPAELPAEIAKGDPLDPRTRLKRMVYQLGIRDERSE